MNKLEDGKGGFDNIRKALKNIKNEIDELKSPKNKKQISLKTEEKITEKKITIKKENKKTVSKAGNSKKEEKMFVIPLGGLEEVGKNMTVLQYKDEIIVVDVGAIFPDESLPGVDLVIPDFTFLENNKEKIKGVFITHAHEDHIGAIPYLYEKIGKDIPIYGGKLTMRSEEHTSELQSRQYL